MFVTRKKTTTSKTTNQAGGVAYELTPELDLYSLVCTTTFNNRFYESATDQLNRMKALVQKVDPDFTAKLAIYAREKMY